MPHQPFQRIVPGSDTAVLCVHGIIGTPDQFLPLLPLIPEAWSVVNLLLPGHGGEVLDFAHTSMDAWQVHVSAAADTLRQTHQRLLLVGHSMGTLLIINEAARRPEQIAGLFLLAAPLVIGPKPSAALDGLRVAFGRTAGHPGAESAQRACSIHITPRLWQYLGWIPRYRELFRESAACRSRIRHLEVPITAVQSYRDELVSRRSCRYLEGLPYVDLHVLPDSRHFDYSPADLAALQGYFQAFLRQFQA